MGNHLKENEMERNVARTEEKINVSCKLVGKPLGEEHIWKMWE